MKLTFVFLVVSGIIFHLEFSEQKQSLMPEAIHQVIEQHYVKNSVKFEIFYNSNDEDVLSKTLKLIKELKEYRVTKINDEDTKILVLEHSGIFLFDTLDNYNKLLSRTGVYQQNSYNMLIYCQDLPSTRGAPKFKMLPGTGASFLIEVNNEIVLKTSTFFSPVRCRELQLIDVNKFSRKSMKWSGSTFFLTIMRDFHGCPLYFGVEPTLFGRDPMDIQYAELFYALAPHLNFKFEQVSGRLDEHSQKVDHDITAIGHSLFSSPLYSSVLVVAVPPGAPYTPIETFFLPFDLETWIPFSLVFILAFTVVVIVKLSRSRSLRVMIIGENVSMPGLNIFGIFMGIGMLSLPSRSISRIFLMNFILFSLIMRTAYQGKYFEFMTSEPNKRPIQTVAELIEKNFTLFVPQESEFSRRKDLYKDNLGRLNFIPCGGSKLTKLMEDIQDPHFKGCILSPWSTFKIWETYSVAHGLTPVKFNLLETEFGSDNHGVVYKRPSLISQIFTLKIEQLLTAGIWEKMESRLNFLDKTSFKKPLPKPYDTVLTLKHLSIGFYIWLLMCLLSTSAFAGEMLKYWGPKVARMLFFHYVLSRFYKMQRSMH